jgi:hypothetical protein
MRKFNVVLITLAVLFITGCVRPLETDLAPILTPMEPKATISVALATEEHLWGYESHHLFLEFEEAGHQRVAISTDITVREFNWVELGHEVVDDNFGFYAQTALYQLDELTPERPFVVTWMNWGTVPHRGITFLDGDGRYRYFALQLNTADEPEAGGRGLFFFAEFEPIHVLEFQEEDFNEED